MSVQSGVMTLPPAPKSAKAPRFRKIEVIANIASGSVGADAPEALARVFADHGLQANIRAPAVGDLAAEMRKAVDAAPDLLVVLAGDGTARAAAEMCGPDGPLVAPLPGGTMNMLPHAVYGQRPWAEALALALEIGEARTLGGGEVEGHRFLCAAILGPPALWAPAREAVRAGRARLAWIRAQRALRRAFTGRLRYSLDGGLAEKAEALVLMCPIASRVLESDASSLEAAALNVKGTGALLRLGVNAILGDWRDDPDVEHEPCSIVRVWSPDSIPALLDGESVRLRGLTEIQYQPAITRILALPKDHA